jgi:hypothetical protein
MDDISAKHHQQLLEYRTYTRNSTPPFRSVSSRNPPRTNLKGIIGLGLLLHRAFAAAATTTNFQLFGPRFTQGENYIQTTIYICYIAHPPNHQPAIASMVRYRSSSERLSRGSSAIGSSDQSLHPGALGFSGYRRWNSLT